VNQQGQGQERMKIGEALARMVHRSRFVLWGVLAVIVVLFLGYFVWNEIDKKWTYDSTVLAEGAQELSQKWSAEQDTQKKAALESDLAGQLSKLISRYPRQYGGQRGLLLRADMSLAKKAWDDAREDYEDLAKRFPRSYLAPIALFNAAVCLEEKGERDAAKALYLKVADSYKDAPVAPRALFGAGRIDEENEAFAEAGKRYDQLASQYPASDWTKLGKNRIIALKVLGKLN